MHAPVLLVYCPPPQFVTPALPLLPSKQSVLAVDPLFAVVCSPFPVHVVHCAWPVSLWYSPFPQLMQLNTWPVRSWYVPLAQSIHLGCPSSTWYLPAMQSAQVISPISGANLPVSQSVHPSSAFTYLPLAQVEHKEALICPFRAMDFPTAQAMQEGWSVSFWYVPAEHGVHKVWPAPAYFPGVQPCGGGCGKRVGDFVRKVLHKYGQRGIHLKVMWDVGCGRPTT